MQGSSRSVEAVRAGAGLGIIALWAAVYVAARLGVEALPAGSGWRAPVAVLPAPFFLAVLWALRRRAKLLDELERRMHFEALAVAFPLSVMLLMVLGLLELAVELNPADWSYRHVWPLFLLFYLFGLVLARSRYQ